MKLYLITYQTRYTGEADSDIYNKRHFNFVKSQKDAATKRREIRQTLGFVPNSIETAKIEVPTNVNGLNRFLNYCLESPILIPSDYGSPD